MMKHLDIKKFVKRIVMDIVVALLCIGGFLFYYYVMPQKNQSAGTAILSTEEAGKTMFSLPSADQVEDENASPEAEGDGEERNAEKQNAEEQDVGSESEKKKPGRGSGSKDGGQSSGQGGSKSSSQSGDKGGMGSGNTNTKSISSNGEDTKKLLNLTKTDTILENYRDDAMQLTIKKTQLGEGDDTVTYYTADVYLTSPEQLKTAFASESFGKNLRESTLTMAADNDAILAISGDSYGNNETGVVVRNGILYRETTNDAEICVLFADGTMRIYTPEEFDMQQILAENVWQIWNFGPSLLEDGEVKESFQTTSYLNGANPRCAIGYVSPGHYKLVLADGRNKGYSKGATMSELAQVMREEGCELAYNLDGGRSSAMVYRGAYVNQPADGGRDISDIIYIGKTKG